MTTNNNNNKSYGTTPQQNVQIIAPSTLSAGYTFEAMYNGTTFPVTVPEGGVTQGQRFIVPFIPAVKAVPVNESSSQQQQHSEIPTGVWRDGLCDCFQPWPFHPHCLNAWCCRSILLGQLLTRMKMTWLGQRPRHDLLGGNDGSPSSVREPWRNSFVILVVLTFGYFFIMFMTSTPQTMMVSEPQLFNETDIQQPQIVELTYDDLSDIDKIKYTVNGWTNTIFTFFVFYLIVKLRATMRQTYSIPEESCLCCYQMGICGNNPREGIQCCSNGVCGSSTPIGWEDVCCSLYCPLCVTAQMARHTVDYREKRGACCNNVGVYGWDDDDDAYVGVEGGVGEGTTLVV